MMISVACAGQSNFLRLALKDRYSTLARVTPDHHHYQALFDLRVMSHGIERRAAAEAFFVQN